jgi:hypothetical protein
MADDRKPVDWAEIERDYRTSPMSVREIARWYGISETAIRKKAKAGGWERPGSQEGSRPETTNAEPEKVYVGTVLTPENTTPEAIVGRGRNLVMRLMDELDATTTRQGELESMIVAATDSGDPGNQREALMQAVSLKQRSDVLKALATAAKTLAESGAPAGVKAERQKRGEQVAQSGGRFSAPSPPLRLVQ